MKPVSVTVPAWPRRPQHPVHLGVPVELPHHGVAHSNISLGNRCSGHDALLDCISGVVDVALFATGIALNRLPWPESTRCT